MIPSVAIPGKERCATPEFLLEVASTYIELAGRISAELDTFAPVPFSAHNKSIDGYITPAQALVVTTAVIEVQINTTDWLDMMLGVAECVPSVAFGST